MLSQICQHPKANTVFSDRQGKRIALETALPRTIGQVKALPVSLGKQNPLPVRLILVRVPSEVAAQRRERLRKEAADTGQPVSEAQGTLAARTLADRTVGSLLEALWSHRSLALGFALAGVVRTLREIDRGGHAPWAPRVWLLARSLAQLVQSCRRRSNSCSGHARGSLWLPSVASGDPQRASHDAIRCRVHRRAAELCLAQILLEGLDWLFTSCLWGAKTQPPKTVPKPTPYLPIGNTSTRRQRRTRRCYGSRWTPRPASTLALLPEEESVGCEPALVTTMFIQKPRSPPWGCSCLPLRSGCSLG